MFCFSFHRKRPGVSLVETVISIMVLAVVILGVMSAVLMARVTVATRDDEEARQLLTTLFEDYEATNLRDLTSKARNMPEQMGIYRVSTEIALSNPSDPKSADVRIMLSWNGAGGNKSISMSREVSASAWQNAGEFPPQG